MKKLNIVKELVNIKSFDMKDNRQIIDYLTEKFQPYCKEILKIKIPNTNLYNLLIGVNTNLKDTKAIILSGHIDTVPANEKLYNTNPYEATLIGDKLYGLGIIDMKCFFASILDCIKEISSLNLPHRNSNNR